MEKKIIPTNTNQKSYDYPPKEDYYQPDNYEEEEYQNTAACFECGSTFNLDEDCPECEGPKYEEEKSHEIKIEEIAENWEYKESRSPIYDTEEKLKLERKIDEVSKELKVIDDWAIDRVNNLTE